MQFNVVIQNHSFIRSTENKHGLYLIHSNNELKKLKYKNARVYMCIYVCISISACMYASICMHANIFIYLLKKRKMQNGSFVADVRLRKWSGVVWNSWKEGC